MAQWGIFVFFSRQFFFSWKFAIVSTEIFIYIFFFVWHSGDFLFFFSWQLFNVF